MFITKICRIILIRLRKGINVFRGNIFDRVDPQGVLINKDPFDYDPENTLDGQPNPTESDPADQLGHVFLEV